jgi:hypothetical protein
MANYLITDEYGRFPVFLEDYDSRAQAMIDAHIREDGTTPQRSTDPRCLKHNDDGSELWIYASNEPLGNGNFGGKVSVRCLLREIPSDKTVEIEEEYPFRWRIVESQTEPRPEGKGEER